MRCLLVVLAFVLWPAAADAAWLEASSEHFVVYSDQSEKEVRQFSELLENFHRALELATQTDLPPPSPSSRLTIFVLDGAGGVQRLAGSGVENVRGLFRPRASGSFAFVSHVDSGRGVIDFSFKALLHEYVHHFQFSNMPLVMPIWLREGSAEFFSAARFTRAGRVDLGLPDRFRMPWIVYGDNVRVQEVLDPKRADKVEGDPFYAKSWILYHYLALGGDRPGQLAHFTRLLSSGTGQLAAAEQAFGDLNQLDRDVRYYRLRKNWDSLTVQGLQTGTIDIRQLREGEAAIMPWLIRSKNGVNRQLAQEVVIAVRPLAMQFPGDPAVFSALAEAEFDAGNDGAAIAAADKALALDPSQVNAYVQKGYALLRRARESDPEEKVNAYIEAVQPFIALNALEHDHPLPLYFFYDSYLKSGREPTALAKEGLEYAFALAPFDIGIRVRLVHQMIVDGRNEEARQLLLPILSDPHNPKGAKLAQRLVEIIDGGEVIDLAGLDALATQPLGEGEDDEE